MSSIFNDDTDDLAKLYVLDGLCFFMWSDSEQSKAIMILFHVMIDSVLFCFLKKERHGI